MWDLARFEYEVELLETFTKEAAAPRQRSGPIPAPQASPETWAHLEAPAGAVRPDSPFYIERTADEQLRRQVLGAGTTTTIQARRQAGKTSLLMQAINAAGQEHLKYVYVDFQLIEDSARENLQELLHHITDVIAEQLDLDLDKADQIWEATGSPIQIFNRYLQREVLRKAGSQILLAIDEADLLLDAPYKANFFALLRAWDSRRAFDPVWRKLNLVMVISTHPYLLIDNVNLSPFNVGLTINLADFTPEQIEELNLRHSIPIAPADLPALNELVGGHPYLVRQALYTLVAEHITLDQLLAQAAHPDGPFGKHLRFYRYSLENNPQFLSAMTQVVHKRTLPDEKILERLVSVGLITKRDGTWKTRCGLYQQFFEETLS